MLNFFCYSIFFISWKLIHLPFVIVNINAPCNRLQVALAYMCARTFMHTHSTNFSLKDFGKIWLTSKDSTQSIKVAETYSNDNL